MGFLESLTGFKTWLLGSITTLTKLNKTQREEIRNIVGSLQDELVKGLNLMKTRFQEAKLIDNLPGMKVFINQSDSFIFSQFEQHKICKNLVDLEDRLKALFDPMKGSIKVGHIKETTDLISTLHEHERVIFEMVRKQFEEITDTLNKPLQPEVRTIVKLLDLAITDCKQKQGEVRQIVGEIVAKM